MLSKFSDPSFTGAYFETQTEFDLMIDAAQTLTPKNPIQVPVADSQYAFGFVYTNLWNERLQEIIERLVPSGIINMHFDRYTKSKWNLMSNELGMDRNLIDIGHLKFVFQIYVIAGYVAFLVFLGERIIFSIIIKLKRKMLEYQIQLEMWKNYFYGCFGQIWAKVPKNIQKSSSRNIVSCVRISGKLNETKNLAKQQSMPQITVEDYDESDSD